MSDQHSAAPMSGAEARDALAAADRSAESMHRQTIAIRVAMGGFALASLAGVLILGLVPMPGSMIGGLTFILGAAIALAVVGGTAKARPAGFLHRYLIAIGVWAAIYVAALVIGMSVFPAEPAFWIPAAIASALPGLWFVVVGARR